jgi:hypothetical protein
MIETVRAFGLRVFYGCHAPRPAAHRRRGQRQRAGGGGRQHRIELFEKMYPHRKDRSKLIAVARQGRLQLERQKIEPSRAEPSRAELTCLTGIWRHNLCRLAAEPSNRFRAHLCIKSGYCAIPICIVSYYFYSN